MRFVVSSNRMRCLNQAAAIGLMAVLGAACSSDFARFDPDRYTASITTNQNPNQNPNQNNVQQTNAYPGDVDPVATASVSRSAADSGIRSGVRRPPLPASNVDGTLPATKYNKNNRYPAPTTTGSVLRQPIKSTTTYNTYNTYNTYQTKDVSTRAAYKQPRVTNRPTSLPVYVDPVTTSSIRPAKPALAPAPAAIPSIVKAVTPKATKTVAPSGWTGIGGTAITLGDGETLFNISKRYGVPVNELKKANKIANADQVRAGQQIIIPTYIYSASAPVSAPDNNPKTRASRASRGMIGEVVQDNIMVPTKSPNNYKPGLAAIESAKRDTLSSVPYVVVSGDTLGAVANSHGVRLSELNRINGLENSNIRVGQKLIIPGKSSYPTGMVTNNGRPVVALAPVNTDRVVTGSTPKPYTKPNTSGAVRTRDVDEKAPPRTGIDTFRWPATGRVLSKFGDRRRGERNDGIDISVPEGTSVKAAENGVVIYSGSELQDYGNLLLIRHAGGWVSAYAHNKTLQVKRGEKVRRGQVIAKSGRTGNAERPMIHFELRKNANPVNPQKYLR